MQWGSAMGSLVTSCNKDLNGDGKISEGARTLGDHGDLKILGDTYSHYFFGIDLNADWKGFDFRAFFQGVLKHDYWGSGNFTGMLFGVRGGYSRLATLRIQTA